MQKVIHHLDNDQIENVVETLAEIVYEFQEAQTPPNYENPDFLISCLALALEPPVNMRFRDSVHQDVVLPENSEYSLERDPLTKLLDGISQNSDAWIRRAAVAHPNAPPEILKRLASDPDDYVRERAASNLQIPTDDLVMLTKNADRSALRGVSKNPNTPVDVLELLAKEEDEWIRVYVATNPSTPQNLVDRLLPELAQDESKFKRLWVAKNTHTPTNILSNLSGDATLFDMSPPGADVPSIQFAIFSNPNSPKEIKDELAHMFFEQVKTGKVETGTANEYLLALAINPSTPISILTELADSKIAKNLGILRALHLNPSVTVEVIAELIRHGEVDSQKHLTLTPDDSRPLLIALSNPRFPVNILSQLENHKDARVRQGVATHPKTPVSTLIKLAPDFENAVRASVASNTKTPVENLGILSQDSSWIVRLNVADNENTPPEILGNLASDEEATVRCIVAFHKNTPIQGLEKLAKDREEIVRFALRQNRNSSTLETDFHNDYREH